MDSRIQDLLSAVRGCTFDDFLFTPQLSVLERRDPSRIDLSSRLSEHITLKRPIVSANMDTVTRAAMAVVQAEEGGIGIIDRGFRTGDIAPQVQEAQTVKRTQHGVIPDPYTIAPDARLEEAIAVMERSGVRTLVVVDGARRLLGLLTERDIRFVPRTARVSERMTPRDRLVVHEGPLDIDGAERLMVAGAMLDSAQAQAIGLVDELAEVDAVVPRARAWLGELLALPAHAMLETRRLARADLAAVFADPGSFRVDEFVEGWFVQETQAVLNALVARLKSKG